ncbi:MAG: Holliday junction branch migration protein RuvA [Lachnospiraceae bacterium]|nr:Holliday junction DNA helicase subunit RuvA [Lachnospiraceae bacterium XPB1003]
MYAYFKGTLAKKKQGSIILETGGIGYNIAYPDGMLDYLPSTGDETVIYTYTSVTQDAISLYGFPNEDALDMFKQLIKVSNVGPKAAMAILSVLNPDSVRIAIATGDTKALAKAKGVSTKTAERIIVDLKNKIELGDIVTVPGVSVETASGDAMNSKAAEDACEALTALGYGRKEALRVVSKALQKAGEDASSDALLKAALRELKTP